MKIKKVKSLQTRYLVLIMCAMLILPISFPIVSMFIYMPSLGLKVDKITTYNGKQLEKMWHEKSSQLSLDFPDEITNTLKEISEQYLQSSVFWVDHQGITRYQSESDLEIPPKWHHEDTIQFMKKSYGGDPFTIVALIGNGQKEGFMVFQIPRIMINPPIMQLEGNHDVVFFFAIVIVLCLFVFISWLFFRKIRKRLLRLQDSMAITDHTIPLPVSVGEKDEIGQLEISFNQMVEKLEQSRLREQEEEKLRRELIANISHDLRTPLSTLRAHSYSLSKETLSLQGQESLKVIDKKMEYLNSLIENLLSYTLLMAGKYQYTPKLLDMNRVLRAHIATWYPIFEKEKLEVDIQLTDQTFQWEIDPHWFERILDNLFQNVVRHAKSGGYISIKTEILNGKPIITIADKGPGLQGKSAAAGVGVGLSIVDLMTKEMNLEWKIVTTDHGTTIVLCEK